MNDFAKDRAALAPKRQEQKGKSHMKKPIKDIIILTLVTLSVGSIGLNVLQYKQKNVSTAKYHQLEQENKMNLTGRARQYSMLMKWYAADQAAFGNAANENAKISDSDLIKSLNHTETPSKDKK